MVMPDTGERIALGFVEAERQRRANVGGAEIIEVQGLLLAFANVPDPPVNFALVISEPGNPARALAVAEAEFVARGRAFGIDVAVARHANIDRAVRSAGLSLLFSWPAMAVRVDDLPEPRLPDGVRVEPVTDARGIAAVARVEVALLDRVELDGGTDVAERFYGPASLGPEGARTIVAYEERNRSASRLPTSIMERSASSVSVSSPMPAAGDRLGALHHGGADVPGRSRVASRRGGGA